MALFRRIGKRVFNGYDRTACCCRYFLQYRDQRVDGLDGRDDGEAFGGEYGVANVALNDALVGGNVASFTLGRDACVLQRLSPLPQAPKPCASRCRRGHRRAPC